MLSDSRLGQESHPAVRGTLSSAATGGMRYHVVLVDSSVDYVAVERQPSGWVLPIVYVPDGDRPSAVVSDSLLRRGIRARIVHEGRAFRAGSNIPESYCLATTHSRENGSRLSWLPFDAALDALGRTREERSQACVVSTCVERLREPLADFDLPWQLDALESWCTDTLSSSNIEVRDGPRVLTAQRFRRVVHWTTSVGDIFLKASTMTVPHECRVADALSELAPGRCVKTLATDSVRGWWLYHGLAGQSFDHRPLTSETCAHIGRSIAFIQRSTCRTETVPDAFAGWELSADDLAMAVDEAARITDGLIGSDRVLAALHTASAWARIREICRDLTGVPHGFLHCDLCLGNIVECDGTIGVIDVEEAYWGPVVLSLWRLIEAMARVGAAPLMARVLDAYIEGWRGAADEIVLRRATQSLGVTGRLYFVKAWLDRFGPNPRPGSTAGAMVRQAQPPVRRLRGLLREVCSY